MAEFLRF